MTAENIRESAVEVTEERRNTRRTRTYKGAILTFNNGYSVATAVIKNLSEKGAMLTMGETTGVPSSAVMEITGENRPRPVQVVWRDASRIGVRFD